MNKTSNNKHTNKPPDPQRARGHHEFPVLPRQHRELLRNLEC